MCPGRRDADFHLHPRPNEPLPTDGWPGNKWWAGLLCCRQAAHPALLASTLQCHTPRCSKPPTGAVGERLAQLSGCRPLLLLRLRVYQNTYVDMASLGPVLDEAMRQAGIPRMQQAAGQPLQAS